MLFILIGASASICLVHTLPRFIIFLSSFYDLENDLDAPTFTLFTIDVCLVVLFMSQHSGLASTTYRQTMESWGLKPVSRSLYVLLTCLMIQLMLYLWQPIPEIKFWHIDVEENYLLRLFFYILHGLFWVVMFLQVTVLEPLHLIGVKQVYHFVRGLPESYLSPQLRQILSRYPHAGAGCFIAILWVQPCMTFDRMLLATVLTAYLCCSFSLSERSYINIKEQTLSSSKTVHYTSQMSTKRKKVQ